MTREDSSPNIYDPMDKMERLGCLYLTFLNYPRGLSFKKISDLLKPAYAGEKESARRKFERDKEELKTMGLELVSYSPGQPLPNGAVHEEYVYIPKNLPLRLPDISLTSTQAEELASILFVHASEIADQGSELSLQIQSAATKLLYKKPFAWCGALSHPTEKSFGYNSTETEQLRMIHESLRDKRLIEIRYPGRDGLSTLRVTESGGVRSQRGRWIYIAFCRSANEIRSFYLDRITDMKLGNEHYKPDPDFKLSSFSLHPLAIRIHPSAKVKLMIDESRLEQWESFLTGIPEPCQLNLTAKNSYTFKTTNLLGLFSFMLRNTGVVTHLGPSDVHEKLKQLLAKMRSNHEEFAL